MSKHLKTMPGEGISQIAYAITRCLEQRILRLFRGTKLHWGLRRLLQQLWQQDGLSQSEVAAAVQSSETSVSNMIKHLLKGGWVERRRDDYDYRISRIYLTEKGRDLRDQVVAELSAADAEMRSAMSKEDADLLADLMNQALDVLSVNLGPVDGTARPDIYDSPGPPGIL
jgi:MarR family transcriptional regulator, organic hydroperoxide resistance regulator